MRVALVCAGAVFLAIPAAAQAAWAPPAVLAADSASTHRAPAIARTAAGDVVAAWARAPVEAGAGSGRIVVSERRAPRGAWSRGRLLSAAGVGPPAVAIGPRGAAVVAWGVRNRLHAAVRDDRAGAWRVAVVAEGPGHVTDIAASVDASGAMALMWSEAIGTRYRVRRSTRPGAGAWRVGAASIVAAARPAMATGAGGNGVVAWTTDDRIAVSRATPTGFERPVEAGAGDSPMPSLGLAAGGRFLLGWRTRLPGGTSMIGAARGDAAGVVRGLGDMGVGDDPRVAMNARGDAAIGWTLSDEGGERGGIQGLVSRAGGAWAPATVVRQTACACRYAVADVEVDGSGGLVVAWRRASRRAADVAVVGSRAARGGPWRRVALQPAPDVSGIDVAADGGHGAAAVWASGGTVRVAVRSGPA